MFGYLTAYREGLTTEDQKTYQSYYCGLCSALKEFHGEIGRTVLNYDLVFLSLLYCGLYEDGTEEKDQLCPLKCRRVSRTRTPSDRFAADMNLMLAYQNAMDQVFDSGSGKAALLTKSLKKSYEKTAALYPRQTKALEDYMVELQAFEKAPEDNPDIPARLTGKMLSEVFLLQEDEFAVYLRPMFYELGRYIYLADAYDDVEKDQKSGAYNPYSSLYGKPDFDEDVKLHLEGILENCTRSFEMLPLFVNRDILRNILYSGTWIRFSRTYKERHEKKEE